MCDGDLALMVTVVGRASEDGVGCSIAGSPSRWGSGNIVMNGCVLLAREQMLAGSARSGWEGARVLWTLSGVGWACGARLLKRMLLEDE